MSYAIPHGFSLDVGDDAFTFGGTLMVLMTYMWTGSKVSGTIARFPLRTIAPLDYCPCGQAGTELMRSLHEVDGIVMAAETQKRQ
ncbi:hypothetical protein PGB90_006126 [Kerria lacca]